MRVLVYDGAKVGVYGEGVGGVEGEDLGVVR